MLFETLLPEARINVQGWHIRHDEALAALKEGGDSLT
jgi:hypothetical protein